MVSKYVLLASILVLFFSSIVGAGVLGRRASMYEEPVQRSFLGFGQLGSVDWWPSFHHDPTHSGYSTSTAPLTNHTIWLYVTGGKVESSPAVVGGCVYVGSDDNKIYCLDASTGALVWSYTTGGIVRSPPAVASGVVFAGSNDGKVYALNANTGALVWNRTNVDSPAAVGGVAGGVVFVGGGLKVYALNASTGALVWSYTTGNEVWSPPAVAGGRVFVGSLDTKVYALNASTGAFLWSYKTGGWVDWSSPAVVNGVVFVGSVDGKVYALNANTGALVWRYTTGAAVESSPAVAGGRVFVGSDDCKMYALNASTGTFLWSYTTANLVAVTSPAVASGVVFVGSGDSKVRALNANTGALIWSYKTGSSCVWSSPAVSDGVVFVGSDDGKVYAFYDLSVTISPSSATLDVGQSRLFTSSVSGGTPPCSYQWYLNDAPVLGATSATWTFTPASAGSYRVYVNVTDSAGIRAKYNTASVTVNPALSLSIGWAPSATFMDVGQSKLFTATVSGGTSPYSYQWYLNGTLVSGATSSTWSFAPSSSGLKNIHVNVTDGAGYRKKSDVASITVNPAPSVNVSPGSVAMDVGQSQLFGASVSGGSPPFTYRWYLNGSLIPGAINSTWTYAPTSSGSSTVYARISDAAAATVTSNSVPVTVNLAPSVVVLPSSATLNIGQSQLFTSVVSGGTPAFMYQWYLDDLPVSDATDATWTFTPSSAGSYSVYVNVSDSVGVQAISDIANVTVGFHDVAVTNVTSSKTIVGQGYNLSITVTATDFGDYTENFNLTFYADTTVIAAQIITLAGENSATVTYTWNTAGFAYGNYTLSGYAEPVLGDTNTTNNTFNDGWVVVTIPGDVDGNGVVSILDVVKITAIYASKEGTPGFNPNSDINDDGEITILDIVICTSHYGEKYP